LALRVALALAVISFAALTPTRTVQREPPRWNLAEILRALSIVETGCGVDEGRDAVGDDGKAIGPFQIHRAYWQDSGVPGRFEDCRDREYASRVVVAYWRRYCGRALETLDAETLARVHNGGPGGDGKSGTSKFWRRVEHELARSHGRESPVQGSADSPGTGPPG
jgi:hypothetical protein